MLCSIVLCRIVSGGGGFLHEREMALRTGLLGLAGATMAIPSSLPFAMFCMDFGKEGAALVASLLQVLLSCFHRDCSVPCSVDPGEEGVALVASLLQVIGIQNIQNNLKNLLVLLSCCNNYFRMPVIFYVCPVGLGEEDAVLVASLLQTRWFFFFFFFLGVAILSSLSFVLFCTNLGTVLVAFVYFHYRSIFGHELFCCGKYMILI
ncbi:hypothetical protein T492DRAFT_19348 [Pavlovales sp. CCMP2436]|nr:hypothetical protein T492DRAFT_19348 [Pavlovales sp. CCMP2436]